MIKLYVIVPDLSSGIIFNNVLNSNGITTEWKYYKIAPRVLENKLTTSRDVVRDMNKIFRTFKNKTQSIIIACNTLQLWLPYIDPQYKKNIKIYTTFEACEWKFKNYKSKPIWLGTTPLVERTEKFKTFISIGKPEIQDKVQEIIWRTKMLKGDDYRTATPPVKMDSKLSEKEQQIKINSLRESVIQEIQKAKITNVILGCTELPMIFTKPKIGKINFIDPAQITAEYIKSQSEALILAGGTISSLPNKTGILSGGKALNILEKLLEALPGSFKNYNITQAAIAYKGLSENMMDTDQKKVLTTIKSAIKSGVSKIIVTHGTDSMEQTAQYVHKNLKNSFPRIPVPIIFTGANEHIGNKQTDAWGNLELALNSEEINHKRGVFIAFGNSIVRASKAVKEKFNGKNMRYVEKGSDEYWDALSKANKKINMLKKRLNRELSLPKKHNLVSEYEVNIVRKDHTKFLKTVLHKEIKAVLFKLYHSGTANTLNHNASVANLAKILKKNGIVCFAATENYEPTSMNIYETSIHLKKAGVIPLFDMPYPVAIHKLKLLYSISKNYTRNKIVKLMLTNFVGEINSKAIKTKY